MEEPVEITYANGKTTACDAARYESLANICFKGSRVPLHLLVTRLGSAPLYLGYDWLEAVNPVIDWKKRQIVALLSEGPDEPTKPNAPILSEIKSDSTPDYLAEFPSVFLEKSFLTLPPSRKWDHPIDLHPYQKEPRGKCYGLTKEEGKALETFLQENLKAGLIRPSASPFAAPFFF